MPSRDQVEHGRSAGQPPSGPPRRRGSQTGGRVLSAARPLVALAVLAGLVFSQGLTLAESDLDQDGFSDPIEQYVGTDPGQPCNVTTVANDESTDAWPPDLDDDTEVTIADVVPFRAAFGMTDADAEYEARLDLNADGAIGIEDIVLLRPYFGGACEPPAPETGRFLETFDGDPAGPQTFYDTPGWDISIQSRFDREFVHEMPFVAHGPDCAPPPATHFNDHYTGMNFKCKNHVMTAIRTGGYGVIYMTPGHIADFSQGEVVIRFNRSTLITSTRDWTDVWITPFSQNLQFPLEQTQPFLMGEPKNAIHIRGTTATVIRDYQPVALDSKFWVGVEEVLARHDLAPSPKRRDTFEIRLSPDHIKYGMSDYDFWWVDSPIEPSLPWDSGIVQLGHHSYNPHKGSTPPDHDCSLVGMEDVCPDANTWHWDNVEIDPARPFTIIHSDRRYVEWGDDNQRVNFDAPAPENAYLRFMTIRDQGQTEVSFDGGQTWINPQPQGAAKRVLGLENCNPPCVPSFWQPIPAGTSSILVRPGEGNSHEWFAFDFRIWSETVPGP